ncbi:hypothetical protein SAMN04489844_4380 [Nocardioides exalbidus]|uniref:Uncharacterized protein n=1 Tax=Nocardioides exalbidus TaxID=402596 RepID=A0A1H5AIA8_9ACTN|nr:hypothetical protein SAMN04489844_4380 [Nocardioides exalbidus]
MAIVGLLVLAPLCAELLSAYLAVAGDVATSAFLVLFLGPLYGGAALLIREVAVRTGRGWTGVVLMAAAFGVAMTALIDLSLWTTDRTDVAGWSDIVGAARVQGVSAFALASWVGGHVALSIGAPLLLVDAGVPAVRGRPVLGRLGIGITLLAALAVAAAVHLDPERSGILHTSLPRYALAAAAVLALVATALSPFGRPRPLVDGRRAGRPWQVFLAGVVLTALLDLAPPGWVGVTCIVVAAVLAVALVGRSVRSPGWTRRHAVALALGVVLERTAVGALAPPAPGVPAGAVVAQAVVLALLLLVVGGWAWRGAGRPAAGAAGPGAGSAPAVVEGGRR